MSVVRNEVRRGAYLDSVALMRIAQAVKALPGVGECGLMMGTPANKRILAEASVLAMEGERAGPGDIVLAIRAEDEVTAAAALAHAKSLLERPKGGGGGAARARAPRTIRSAVQIAPDANLAVISVPGGFAAAEARKALTRGLNVMLFSDNVSVADEVALKREAAARGQLLMGPDCGTAIVAGVPLGFANAVPRGDIGLIGASGTGIQEVSCLIANNGGGISHAIGTGGRDLSAQVGGLTTLLAIDLLEADPATRHIVLISKPPAAEVAAKVMERVGRSRKPFTICFIGGAPALLPANAKAAATLKEAAELALGKTLAPLGMTVAKGVRGPAIRGLFAGGTLCAEAQVVALQAGKRVASNVPVPGAEMIVGSTLLAGHCVIDLGSDEYTQGRPHPMIEPAVRDAALAQVVAEKHVGVVLLDVVLGYGAHPDPAGHLVRVWREITAKHQGAQPLLVASITGTDRDPQRWIDQYEALSAIAVVCHSNADAVEAALRFVAPRGG